MKKLHKQVPCYNKVLTLLFYIYLSTKANVKFAQLQVQNRSLQMMVLSKQVAMDQIQTQLQQSTSHQHAQVAELSSRLDKLVQLEKQIKYVLLACFFIYF